MRFMIFSYNPSHVAQDVLSTFKGVFETKFDCYVYFIPHHDDDSEPIYCVQFVDTK